MTTSDDHMMRPTASLPSVNYLLRCSKDSLQDLELAALSRAAQHLKTAKLEWEEAAAQKEIAGVARWLIECREQLLEQSRRSLDISPVPEFPNLLFPNVVEVTGPKKGLDALLGPPKEAANEASEDRAARVRGEQLKKEK